MERIFNIDKRRPIVQFYGIVLLCMMELQVARTSSIMPETRCPVYNDDTWKARDSECKDETSYHCQADENGMMEVKGCFSVKTCRKGSHPVVENDKVVCLGCPEGTYQPTDVRSNEYEYTTCIRHDVCRAKYGKSECRPGSPEYNTACSCFEPYTPIPKTCVCFTKDDACDCKFLGCPNGTNLRDGTCISGPTLFSSPSTVPTLQGSTPNAEQPSSNTGMIIGIVLSIVFIAIIIIIIIIGLVRYYRKCWHRQSRPGDERDAMPSNGAVSPSSESTVPLINGSLCNGHTTSSSAADVLVQTDQQRPETSPTIVINVNKLKTLNVLSTTAQNGNCGNVNQDTSLDENPHESQDQDGHLEEASTSDVCPEEDSENRFPPSTQVTLNIDPSEDMDAAPGNIGGSGQISVMLNDDETPVKVVSVVPNELFGEACETVPKTVYSSTNMLPRGTQETHVFEEPEETDRFLQEGETSELEVSLRTNVSVGVNQETKLNMT